MNSLLKKKIKMQELLHGEYNIAIVFLIYKKRLNDYPKHSVCRTYTEFFEGQNARSANTFSKFKHFHSS